MNVKILEKTPSVGCFMRLRAQVGWSEINESTAKLATNASLFAVTAISAGQEIGFGRIIGDGMYFYVQDIVVDKEFRNRRIGFAIMSKILEWLSKNTPKGAFVGLMAAADTEQFYEQFGFVKRNANAPGMFLRIE